MQTYQSSLTCLLLLIFCSTANAAEFTELARIQGEAPGNGKFGRFAQVFKAPIGSVSSNGHVHLMAGIYPESEPTTMRWGALSHSAGGVELVAIESNLAVSSSGTIIERIAGSGIVNDSGAMAFQAMVRQGGDSLNAVFVSAGDQLELVAIQKTTIPGLPEGVSMEAFEGLAFNKDGTIAFLATLSGGNSSSLDRALVTGQPGSLSVLMLTGASVPGFAEGTMFRQLSVPMLNSDGELCVLAEMTGPDIGSNDNAGFWVGKPDQLELVLREGDSVPGHSETTVFSSTGFTPNSPTHSFADGRQFAFLASITGPGVNRAAARIMFAGVLGESLEVIARSGDSAPGLGDIPFDTGLSSHPLTSSSGSVTFIGSLDPTHPDVEGGIFGGTDTALFHGKPGDIKLIARRGSPKPGLEGTVFGAFNFGTQIGMSASGWMAFRDNGINVVDPDGNLVFVVSDRETEIDRGDGEFRQVIASGLFGPLVRSSGSDGRGGLVSSKGEILALMTFLGEAQTVYRISLSQPQEPLAITSIEWDSTEQQVAIRFPSTTEHEYALENSSNLTDWTTAQDNIAGTGTEVTLRLPRPEAQTHWRVRAK